MICTVQAEGCVGTAVYELNDANEPALYCYACLPERMMARAAAGQLTLRSTGRKAVAAAPPDEVSLVAELPPARAARGGAVRMDEERRQPQMKPDRPNGKAGRLDPLAWPTSDPPDPRLKPVTPHKPDPKPPGPPPKKTAAKKTAVKKSVK